MHARIKASKQASKLSYVSPSKACWKVNTVGSNANLFRLVAVPGHGARILPLELVPGHAAKFVLGH